MICVRSIYCGDFKVYIELNFFIILKVYLMKYILNVNIKNWIFICLLLLIFKDDCVFYLNVLIGRY